MEDEDQIDIKSSLDFLIIQALKLDFLSKIKLTDLILKSLTQSLKEGLEISDEIKNLCLNEFMNWELYIKSKINIYQLAMNASVVTNYKPNLIKNENLTITNRKMSHRNKITYLENIQDHDKTFIASGSEDSYVKIWKHDFTCLKSIKCSSTSSITCLKNFRISNQSHIAIGSSDGQVRILNIFNALTSDNPNFVESFSAHKYGIICMEIVGDLLVTCGLEEEESNIKIWDLYTYQLVEKLPYSYNFIDFILLIPGDYLAIAGETEITSDSNFHEPHSIAIWDLVNQKSLCFLTAHQAQIVSLLNIPQRNEVDLDQLIASASIDNWIIVWNITKGEINLKMENVGFPYYKLLNLIYINNNCIAAAFNSDKTSRIVSWDLTTGSGVNIYGEFNYNLTCILCCKKTVNVLQISNFIIFSNDLFEIKYLDLDSREIVTFTDLFRITAHYFLDSDIALGFQNGVIQLWSTYDNSFQLSSQLGCHESGVSHISRYTPVASNMNSDLNRIYLISSSDDKSLRIWDLKSKQCVSVISGYNSTLYDCHVINNGKYIYTAGVHKLGKNKIDKIFSIKNIQEEKMLHTFCTGIVNYIEYIYMNGDSLIATASDRHGIISLFNANSKKLKYNLDHGDVITGLLFIHPCNLASSSRDKSIKLWNLNSTELLFDFIGHTFESKFMLHVFLENNGHNFLVSSSLNGEVIIWDIITGELFKKMEINMISRLIFIPPSENIMKVPLIVSGGMDKPVKLWNIENGECVLSLDLGGISDLIYVPPCEILDNIPIIATASNMLIELWNVNTGEMIQKYLHDENINRLVYINIENLPIICGAGLELNLWNLKTGELISSIESIDNSTVSELKYISPMNNTLNIPILSCNYINNKLRVYNLDTFECITYAEDINKYVIIPYNHNILNLTLIAAIVKSSTGMIQIWNLFSRNKIKSIPNKIKCMLYVPSDASNSIPIIISSNADEWKVVEIWNGMTSECLGILKGHFEDIIKLSYVPFIDNSRKSLIISSGSLDGTVKLWEFTSRKCIHTFEEENKSYAECMMYIPSDILGVPLISYATLDNTIKLWNVDSFECLKILEGHQGKITNLVYVSKGKFVSGDVTGIIKIWNLNNIECLFTLDSHYGTRVNRILSIPENNSNNNEEKFILTAGKSVILSDLNTGEQILTLEESSDEIKFLTYIPSMENTHKSPLIISVSTENTIKIFNMNTRGYIYTMEVTNKVINSLIYIPPLENILQLPLLVVGLIDEVLQFFNINTGENMYFLESNIYNIDHLSLIPSSENEFKISLLICGSKRTLNFLSINQILRESYTQLADIISGSNYCSISNTEIGFVDYDNTFKIIDVPTCQIAAYSHSEVDFMQTLTLNQGTSAGRDPQSQFLLVHGYMNENSLYIIDMENLKSLKMFQVGGKVETVFVERSNEKVLFACGMKNGEFQLFDYELQNLIGRYKFHSSSLYYINSFKSNDNLLFISADLNGVINIFDDRGKIYFYPDSNYKEIKYLYLINNKNSIIAVYQSVVIMWTILFKENFLKELSKINQIEDLRLYIREDKNEDEMIFVDAITNDNII